jgi:GR25 family glycosyltransferase involved in LPS biosynthesis
MNLRPRMDDLPPMRWSLPPRGTAKTVSDLVGEVYVISLPWRRERLRRFFKDYGSVLGSVTVVDGRAVLDPDRTDQTHREHRTPLTAAENRFLSGNPEGPGRMGISGHTGCALAHAAVWRRASAQELIMVLEDDVCFVSPATLVDDVWDCLDAWRSRSAMKSGILFLNGGCVSHRRHPGQTVTVNPMKTFFTAECYLISRGLSKVLLDDWDRVGIQHAVDMSIWFFIRSNRPSTHGFATDVPLAGQRPGLPSDISKSHAKN